MTEWPEETCDCYVSNPRMTQVQASNQSRLSDVKEDVDTGLFW